MSIDFRGKLFVVSSPSGGGKTTVCAALCKRSPRVFVSVSATTRAPRREEKNGRDYYFMSRKEFARLRKNRGFFEWAEVLGNWYGTPKKPILKKIRQGFTVLLNIDIQGARQVKKACPDATTIFIMPPSLRELRARLTRRSTESLEEIKKRLALATREIAARDAFDYLVINKDLPHTIEVAASIIIAEQHRNAKRRLYA